MKKLLITAAAAAMVFGSAAGVLAHGGHRTPAPLPTTTVVNTGTIDNTSVNVANTGANFVSAPAPKGDPEGYGRGSKGVSVTTGGATASQTTWNEIDTTSNCGCSTGGNTSVENTGYVYNLSVNVANTGLNGVSGGSLTTGDASAGQAVTNVINTSVGPATP